VKYSLDEAQCSNLEITTRKEWILTNGIGGFAMGTVSGINTRRYHGHLIAATRPPTHRTLLLTAINAFIQGDGNPIGISSNQYPGAIHPEGHLYLRGFSAGKEIAWQFKAGALKAEKRMAMHPGLNAVTLRYLNNGDKPFQLLLRPLVAHKFYHDNFHEQPGYPHAMSFPRDRTSLQHGGVTFTLSHPKAQRTPVQGWYYRFEYAREADRGLEYRDDLFCPCELRYELLPGESALIVCAEGEVPPPLELGLPEDSPPPSLKAALQDAAAKFVVDTPERATIIAGYPWFTDWGRDTMISLPGLCLHTGRHEMARRILHDYASQIFKGLIPNRFVEKGETPEYNTVDATLWFANAIYATLNFDWDEEFARSMCKGLGEIIRWHQEGTLYGIKVDPNDGLLTQGEKGVQLTWMDAKVGDWVVTPRHGKPVEINGLWINALRVHSWLCGKLELDDSGSASKADEAEKAFEEKFWHEVRGHYLDTVDPMDASLRPNQVIAMALPFGPARGENAKRALSLVARELLTPYGLRTLGPQEMGYCGQYAGPLPQLDAAYHQGTAWPWLLGPYVTALIKLTGDVKEGKRILKGARSMLSDYGLGGIAEVYDGNDPQKPNGCPWQAWSVAEILRAWVEDCNGD
jgi:glycogen debranching enzyme